MRQFVKIVNRGSYTNSEKAMRYVERGFAAVVSASDTGIVREIRMLEESELAIVRSSLRARQRDIDPVRGSFEWFVGDSGGSKLMKQYEGISGGTRVFQATHGQ